MSFWGELKRRNVFKVGVAYAIVAWLILQVAAITFPVLHLPGWALTLVTVLLIIGFPLILLFAWAFEITPDGIKRTEHVPLAESITNLTGQKLNYIVTGLLVVAVAVLVIDNYIIGRKAAEPEVASVETARVPEGIEETDAPKTIAVMPFVNLSPDPDQEYFVDGLSEELLNSLAKIKDLRVIARTSSFAFKGTDKKVQEIADELGASHILEGSVRKDGKALRITAQLIEATDGVHLWSNTYNRELKDIFAVQEDIATTVADELKVTFKIDEPWRKLGGTENVGAYELYLSALGQSHEATYDIFLRGLASLDAAISLDPEFANAWATKAFYHAHLSIIGPAENCASEQHESLRAALKTIELEPNLAAGHFQLGWVKTLTGDWIEAELAYRRALELTTDPFSYEFAPFSNHYLAVGNVEKAKELAEKFLDNNPYHKIMHVFYMVNLYVLGDAQGAEEEYRRSMEMFDGESGWGVVFSTFSRLGTDSAVPPEDISDLPVSYQIWSLAREYFESPEEGLEEMRRAYEGGDNLATWDFMQIALWAAYFGDAEFAMEAMEKELRMAAVDFMFVWLPVMHDVRQTPRFKEFVREIGLVEYWKEFGWPDMCRQLENEDFVCD